MTGRKLINPLIDGVRRRNISTAHISGQSVTVDHGLKSGENLEGFEFRREGKASVNDSVIKMLDSYPVAYQEQPLVQDVPQREGKHSHNTPDCPIQPPAFYGCQHHLGI